jgi:aryl-alcohol dehydrogenase-like predicted oxidoreductase
LKAGVPERHPRPLLSAPRNEQAAAVTTRALAPSPSPRASSSSSSPTSPCQVLRRVADKHNVSVANVSLRWVMQAGGAAPAGLVVPIVGLRSAEHIEDNARALGFALDASDLGEIEAVLSEATWPGAGDDIYSFERAG